MSDTIVGRGLYPFAGLSTNVSSPTSDPTASTWASKPIPGQRAFEIDTLNVYEFNSSAWIKISTQNSYAKDREHNTSLAAGNVNGIFTEADDATKLVFKLYTLTGATAINDVTQLEAHAWVCFDPPSDAVGDIWLTAGDHTSDDAMRRKISILEPLEIEFPSYLTSYRLQAGYIPAGMTIGCTVEVN